MTLNAEVIKTVKKVARSVAFQWPETITADDLEQDLFIEVLRTASTERAITEAEPGARYKMLARLAHRCAGKQRDDYDHFTGNYRYSVDEVKRLLSAGALDREAIDGFDSASLDLEQSITCLWAQTATYAESITTRYSGEWKVPDSGAAQVRLSEGLTSLTDGMNRSFKSRNAAHSDGPGTRTVISNSAARSITEGL